MKAGKEPAAGRREVKLLVKSMVTAQRREREEGATARSRHRGAREARGRCGVRPEGWGRCFRKGKTQVKASDERQPCPCVRQARRSKAKAGQSKIGTGRRCRRHRGVSGGVVVGS